MSAGQRAGERARLAEELQRQAGRLRIAIELRETAGSDQALQELDRGRLDLVLAQGGLNLSDRPNLRQVASLHIEPLHLLVEPELVTQATLSLSALRGKVVGLGEPGSGTAALASDVLSFVGLRHGDFQPSGVSYAELLSEPDRDHLPDAVFMVSTLPSPVARHLVERHGYRLVPLPFFEAFSLSALDQPARRVDRRHVYAAFIPPYAYQVEPEAVPARPLETLGTQLLLVTRLDVSARTVERLLDVVFNSPFAKVVVPPLDPRAQERPAELPLHEGTQTFLKRNTPLIADDLVDLIEKELSIVGAVVGGLFFLGQWLRRRYRRRRDRGFEAYILRVHEIERKGLALERSVTLDLAGLLRLQNELAVLKGEALQKFADGALEGEELMSGFLAHVSDTRDYLTRLILHERDNLEDQAHLEGREAHTLWREAVAGSGTGESP
jgi:TRAP-type uncharacterized transport system substrate-binding protein